MWLRFLLPLSAAALTLAACQQQQAKPPAAAAPPPPEQAPPPPAEFKEGEVRDLPQQCSAARPAKVSLSVRGRNGDAFRVILTCNGQEVARCSAAVAVAGGAIGTNSCSDGPKPAVNGPARCVLGVGNGNSADAVAPAWGCLN